MPKRRRQPQHSTFVCLQPGDFTIEQARSDRSCCKCCGKCIDKGAVRIGIVKKQGNHVIPQWYLPKHFFAVLKKPTPSGKRKRKHRVPGGVLGLKGWSKLPPGKDKDEVAVEMRNHEVWAGSVPKQVRTVNAYIRLMHF